MIRFAVSSKFTKTACMVLPVFQEQLSKHPLISELDKRYGGVLSTVINGKDFEGKKFQTTTVYTSDASLPRILLIGLGAEKAMTLRVLKQALGMATISVQQRKIEEAIYVLSSEILKRFGIKKCGMEAAVAVAMAEYAFDEHKDIDAKVRPIKAVTFQIDGGTKAEKEFATGLREGEAIAVAVNFTRRLGNVPPSLMTPTRLAKEAQGLSRISKDIRTTILSRPAIKKLGMGCFLGVSQGSVEEPKFIIVEYWGGKKSEKPTVLVGKGITFDSGGLSIKPESYMRDMKFDMLGAATVLGSISAAAALKLKKNIVGLIPSCENMPSGSAYRPDDILTAMNGKTVLISNTDAEGRLILADALCYARKYQPKEVIDLATLTGACMVALGLDRSGLFSPEDGLVQRLLKSAEAVGEQLWRLPLGEEYGDEMKSDVADIKNMSDSRNGGASTGAAFLEFFTRDEKGQPLYPWAHVDMSACFSLGKGKPHLHTGATGETVQTMVEYLRS